jgi:hypothetical protein
MKKGKADWHDTVTDAEHNALEMLVGLFDWLDGLKQPQPMPMAQLPQSIQEKNSAAFALVARGARLLSNV